MASKASPFLTPGTLAQPDKLAIIHLKRDLQYPMVLRERDEDGEGYAEGKVVNTRFGSFPHSTLLGKPWGSQILASNVDTGSRGRRDRDGVPIEKKRKRDSGKEKSKDEPRQIASKRQKIAGEEDGQEDVNVSATAPSTPTSTPQTETEARTATTGFVHLLAPTPENWTSSLPHRTQVVYTPDYSYILHRLKARPGSQLIEAGAGSGSFTHASARAVYHGYSSVEEDANSKKRKLGKVWSYEFHAQRHEKLQAEIIEHELQEIVQITHRDVCEGGFLVDGQSPGADAVFLDLPAPWLALPHLVRSKAEPFISPLNPSRPVHICSFSPCIEQVQRTMSTMRQLGWVDIEMVAVAHKRFEIRRERIGIDNGAARGLQTIPASVDEAVQRLLEVEGNFKSFHGNGTKATKLAGNPNNRAKIMESLVEKKIYKEGRLVHRTEPEVKTHTSYLVFAILPQEWSEADEERAKAEWPVEVRPDGGLVPGGQVVHLSNRAMKKAAKLAKKLNVEKGDAGKETPAVNTVPTNDAASIQEST